ncbi:secreted RxLR effector protein 161-like [Coffea arabica]|uniref:Secreted RxLR effector protein 161-like n=1 Tax=Coffea arabica TaxID=13443 RepID=A0ABM4V9B5_COFAR
MVAKFRKIMTKQFEMTNMELMSYFLGIEVFQFDSGIFISQKKYASDILKKFKMDTTKPIMTPVEEKLRLTKEGVGRYVNPTYFKGLVGSFRYLTSTRLDINFVVGLISGFMKNSCQSYFQATKTILKYTGGIRSDSIFYSGSDPVELFGYTDINWTDDTVERKSTSGYAFFIGSNLFSWSSKKQQVIALFTVEAEYIATTNSAIQVLWLRRILGVL